VEGGVNPSSFIPYFLNYQICFASTFFSIFVLLYPLFYILLQPYGETLSLGLLTKF